MCACACACASAHSRPHVCVSPCMHTHAERTRVRGGIRLCSPAGGHPRCTASGPWPMLVWTTRGCRGCPCRTTCGDGVGRASQHQVTVASLLADGSDETCTAAQLQSVSRILSEHLVMSANPKHAPKTCFCIFNTIIHDVTRSL